MFATTLVQSQACPWSTWGSPLLVRDWRLRCAALSSTVSMRQGYKVDRLNTVMSHNNRFGETDFI